MFFITSFSILKIKRVQTAFPYYTNLANASVKENKYKTLLYFTQKAINYCDNNGKTEDKALQTYNLGKIYYDLNRYTDARESFYRKYFFVPKFTTYSSICQHVYYLSFPIVKNKQKFRWINQSLFIKIKY
jgi:tetratricopeptide (TPR) repeat protein